EVGGDLAGGGRAAQALGQLVAGRRDGQVQLLEPAWDADRPAGVTEVVADLPHYRRYGEGEEVGAAVRVEPVHGVDQADRRHLDQVLVGLTAVGEPAGDVLGH